MLEMLELKPGMKICDLGSGCGLTGNTFAKFGCTVLGFEPGKRSVEIANKYAKIIGVEDSVKYMHGYTNDLIGDG
jgi:2-polyprenyl-3-methyl-5-hydroxy-6-metoxy-1,4-benzoquinol methylase